MVKGIIGGLIAAVIGAGVWAAIAYFTGYEIGWIAWGIGALVGFVAAKAAGDDAGDGLGIVAAVIAVLAILGGKYAVGHAQATKYFAEHPPVKFTDSLMISLEARTIAEKMEAAGTPVDWPAGHDASTASEKEHFPPSVWDAASKTWSETPESRRADMKKALEADQAQNRSAAPWKLFKASFSLWDILFIGLALVSAFQLGSGSD
jgi:phosphate/sulfate permease